MIIPYLHISEIREKQCMLENKEYQTLRIIIKSSVVNVKVEELSLDSNSNNNNPVKSQN
jgi:ribosomal protein S8E